tara:strand:+ start:481 stop:651 length:171 start_codon:yes stop_codon:yes gene_type:complete
MKDKITQLRKELKVLNKSKKIIHKKKSPIQHTTIPYIKKEKIYIQEEINNNILEKL